ncbi:MAG: hypothetical protein AB2385_16270, partial [Symbiobacterium sp.]|uniref:hypothetical protein n=1 Tax=Symbiobacterium sp. TaxID=1971213 RepID=UPI003463D445
LHCLVFKVRDPLPSGDSFYILAGSPLAVNRPIDGTFGVPARQLMSLSPLTDPVNHPVAASCAT